MIAICIYIGSVKLIRETHTKKLTKINNVR